MPFYFPIFSDENITHQNTGASNDLFLRTKYSSPAATLMKIVAPTRGYIYMAWQAGITVDYGAPQFRPRTEKKWCLFFKPQDATGFPIIPGWTTPRFNEIMFFVDEFTSDETLYGNNMIARTAFEQYLLENPRTTVIPIHETNTSGGIIRGSIRQIEIGNSDGSLESAANSFAQTYWNNGDTVLLPVKAGQTIIKLNADSSKSIEVCLCFIQSENRPIELSRENNAVVFNFDTHRYFQLLRGVERLGRPDGGNFLWSRLGENFSQEIDTLESNAYIIKTRGNLRDIHTGEQILVDILNPNDKIKIQLDSSLGSELDIPGEVMIITNPIDENGSAFEVTDGLTLPLSSITSFRYSVVDRSDLLVDPFSRTMRVRWTDLIGRGGDSTVISRFTINIALRNQSNVLDIILVGLYDPFLLLHRLNLYIYNEVQSFFEWRNRIHYHGIKNEDIIPLYEQIRQILSSSNIHGSSMATTIIRNMDLTKIRYFVNRMYGPDGFKGRIASSIENIERILSQSDVKSRIRNGSITNEQYSYFLKSIQLCSYFEEGENLINRLSQDFFITNENASGTPEDVFMTFQIWYNYLGRTQSLVGNITETMSIFIEFYRIRFRTTYFSSLETATSAADLASMWASVCQAFNDDGLPFHFEPLGNSISINLNPLSGLDRFNSLAEQSLNYFKTFFITPIDYFLSIREVFSSPNWINITDLSRSLVESALEIGVLAGPGTRIYTISQRTLPYLSIVGTFLNTWKAIERIPGYERRGEMAPAILAGTITAGSLLTASLQIAGIAGASFTGLTLFLGTGIILCGIFEELSQEDQIERYISRSVLGINYPVSLGDLEALNGNINRQRSYIYSAMLPMEPRITYSTHLYLPDNRGILDTSMFLGNPRGSEECLFLQFKLFTWFYKIRLYIALYESMDSDTSISPNHSYYYNVQFATDVNALESYRSGNLGLLSGIPAIIFNIDGSLADTLEIRLTRAESSEDQRPLISIRFITTSGVNFDTIRRASIFVSMGEVSESAIRSYSDFLNNYPYLLRGENITRQ